MAIEITKLSSHTASHNTPSHSVQPFPRTTNTTMLKRFRRASLVAVVAASHKTRRQAHRLKRHKHFMSFLYPIFFASDEHVALHFRCSLAFIASHEAQLPLSANVSPSLSTIALKRRAARYCRSRSVALGGPATGQLHRNGYRARRIRAA